MAWTDKMVEDLKKMWKDGMTTGEIGKKLGVSKNSIVGKVHRLGLSGRPSPIKKKDPSEKSSAAPSETPKNTATTPNSKKEKSSSISTSTVSASKEDKNTSEKKSSAPTAEPVLEEVVFTPVLKKNPQKNGKTTLVDLDNHTCRWPIGDPKDENFHFCGKKVKIGQTYCDEHAAIAYVKPGKKITFV